MSKKTTYIHAENNNKILSSNEVRLYVPPEPEKMKVLIWGKELCNGAEWYDFLKCVEEKTQENEQLKQQLAQVNERLKGAIIPRYELGTKLYMIPTEFNRLKSIKDYELLSISLSYIGLRYNLCLNKKEKGVEQFYYASEDMFGQSIFSTFEEATKKLQELRGGR